VSAESANKDKGRYWVVSEREKRENKELRERENAESE
jgi:hypothetical protein